MPYSKKLTFVLSEKEKTALAALAKEDSSSQASVLRRLIRLAAKERELWIPPEEHDDQQDAALEEVA